ncbi:MAG TPA: surface-adhesin E family protein [Candidatus Sulfotelmatobacter sp.]
MKRALIAVIAVILAPVVLVSLVAIASGEWRTVGETGNGDQVSVSSVRVLKNNQRMAWVRVEYKEPIRLPQGGPFVELRARVHFNCLNGNSNPSAEWFYSRDHSGKFVVTKKTRRDDLFGTASEGSFGGMASKFVCGQK